MPRPNRKSHLVAIWMSALLVLFVGLSQFPFRHAPFSDNEGTYTSITQELEKGAELYRDTWDNKPPLLYAQFLAERAVLDTSPEALRFYVFLIHCLDAFLLFSILKKVGCKGMVPWYGAFAYATFVCAPNFQPWLAEADLLMQPFLLGSFLLALYMIPYAWIASGLFWAIAFFTKQSALFLLPVFIPLFQTRIVRKSIFFAMGAALLTAIVLAPFVADGRIGSLFSAVFGISGGQSGAYLKDGWADFWQQDFTRENIVFQVGASALAVYSLPIVLAISCFLERRAFDRRIIGGLLLWLISSIVICCLRGYFFTYYFFILLPPMAILIALGLSELEKKKSFVFKGCLVWLVLFAGYNIVRSEEVPLHTIMGIFRNKDYSRDEPFQVGQILAREAQPGDKLLAWSYEPQIYTYSGLGYSQIKSMWLYQLGKTPEVLDGIKHDFCAQPPRFVVLHNYQENPAPPDWLAPFLDQKYEKFDIVGDYLLYRLKDGQR